MKKFIQISFITTLSLLLSGCFLDKKAEEYGQYVKSAMDASYLGEFDNYLELADTTEEDSIELYNNTISYLAYAIMDYNYVNYDVISEETIEKYYELAKKALQKTNYKVNDAKKVDGIYQVKAEITPIDVLESTYDDVDEYIDIFNAKYPDLSSLSTEKLIEAEEEYADEILKIITPYVDNMNYKDTISKIVEIQFDDDGLYGISEDEWEDIDNYVMGLK